MQVNCRREKLYVMRMLSTAHGMALVSPLWGPWSRHEKKMPAKSPMHKETGYEI